jgi:hypothetical protein
VAAAEETKSERREIGMIEVTCKESGKHRRCEPGPGA